MPSTHACTANKHLCSANICALDTQLQPPSGSPLPAPACVHAPLARADAGGGGGGSSSSNSACARERDRAPRTSRTPRKNANSAHSANFAPRGAGRGAEDYCQRLRRPVGWRCSVRFLGRRTAAARRSTSRGRRCSASSLRGSSVRRRQAPPRDARRGAATGGEMRRARAQRAGTAT